MGNEVHTTTLKYVIVGPEAGKTVNKAKGEYRFVNGVLSIEVREDQISKYNGLTRLLARSYNAHPEGSRALDRALADWESNPANKKGNKDAVRSAGKNSKGQAGVVADSNKGSAGAKDGTEGHEAETGDESGTGDGEGDVSTPMTLEKALDSLDPENDDHWTKNGLPNLKTLIELTGSTVNRADIEAVVTGFTRDVAREAENN